MCCSSFLRLHLQQSNWSKKQALSFWLFPSQAELSSSRVLHSPTLLIYPVDIMSVPALTTIFTPASSCLYEMAQFDGSSFGTLLLGPDPTPTECYPKGWQPVSTFYFSPGICPSGFTTACTTSLISSSGQVTETVATCCPR